MHKGDSPIIRSLILLLLSEFVELNRVYCQTNCSRTDKVAFFFVRTFSRPSIFPESFKYKIGLISRADPKYRDALPILTPLCNYFNVSTTKKTINFFATSSAICLASLRLFPSETAYAACSTTIPKLTLLPQSICSGSEKGDFKILSGTCSYHSSLQIFY